MKLLHPQREKGPRRNAEVRRVHEVTVPHSGLLIAVNTVRGWKGADRQHDNSST